MAAVAGIRAATATLTADTADAVTLSGASRKPCEIVNQGTDSIYFRTDGVTAVGEADENNVVLGGERLFIGILGDDPVVSLISSGTPTYTVNVIS